MTTVLGWHKGSKELDQWRERVGAEKAAKVSRKATGRGSRVHDLAERYVLNQPDWSEGAMPANTFTFEQVRPILDSSLGIIYGVEVPLWSDQLKTAGRTDLVAEWLGVPSIIDYKTSKRTKSEQEVHGYFLQKTCYGLMLEERIGFVCPQIVTVMMVDHDQPQVWVRPRRDYEMEVREVFGAVRPDQS